MERISTIVIGGGQAGLSVGYFLARAGVPFVILDANARIGDAWRRRWDSLRLFTPAKFDGLAGMPFPADRDTFPTKDAMGDYLEAYARRFSLPVRSGTRVTRLARHGRGFVAEAGRDRYEADNVIVAMSNYQQPVIPDFASTLASDIVQLHSREYRNPAQLAPGATLIVGAGNSGAEIAMELARHGDRVILSGRDTGHLPFRIEGRPGRWLLGRLVLRVLFHRVLTMNTPMGRAARPKLLSQGTPLIRIKPKELLRAGVERAPRVAGVRDGRPLLADGRVVDVQNVVWCTGFAHGHDWIDLPTDHRSGVVPEVPGLYFVGLNFLHAVSSGMIHGVGRDAERIAGLVAGRAA